jgi:hypothetical protein
MKFEEYWTGVDNDPVRVEMRPDQKDHVFSPQRRSTFLAKLGDKSLPGVQESSEPLRQPVTQIVNNNEELKSEIENLT